MKLEMMTDAALHGRDLILGDGDALQRELAGRDRIDIVYYPDINEYNGNRTLQAVIRNYKAAELRPDAFIIKEQAGRKMEKGPCLADL